MQNNSSSKRNNSAMPSLIKDSNNLNNSNSTVSNTNSTSRAGLYWEGPPAHFMLPTHAIHCRSSRSIERCPRACKGKLLFVLIHSFNTALRHTSVPRTS